MIRSAEQLFPSKTTVLVTAGASGIGRRIAEKFAENGCRVHVCDIDEEAIHQVTSLHYGITATKADVSNSEDVARVFSDIESRYGELDVVINNAGIAGPTAAVEDIDENEWNKTIAIDLSAPFYVTKKAVPLLKKKATGSIINIASSAAFFGYPLRSPYTAAKWGLVGLTKTWAMELGPHQIRVNAICPGSVEGARIDRVIRRDAEARGVDESVIRKLYVAQTSLETFVTADDIANMAIYLSSTLGRTISGQVLGIDGHTESLSAKV